MCCVVLKPVQLQHQLPRLHGGILAFCSASSASLTPCSCCRYEAETAEQRVLFRGTFATQRPGGAASNAMDV